MVKSRLFVVHHTAARMLRFGATPWLRRDGFFTLPRRLLWLRRDPFFGYAAHGAPLSPRNFELMSYSGYTNSLQTLRTTGSAVECAQASRASLARLQVIPLFHFLNHTASQVEQKT